MENCPSDHPAGGRETSGPAGMDEAGLRSKVAEEIAQEIEGTYCAFRACSQGGRVRCREHA